MVFSACGFNLFSIIFSMTLSGWLMKPSVVLALLQFAFLGKGFWLRTGSGGLTVLLSAKSCCRLSWKRWLHLLHLLGPVLMGWCRLQLTSLSSMIVLQPPVLCKCRPLCVSDGSSLALWLYSSEQYSVHRFSICLSSVRLFFSFFLFFWTILDSGSFSLFNGGQFFYELVCPLIVILPQIFFSLTTLLFYPDFFCPFHAPVDVAVHFLVLLNSFRFESLLSQFSPLVAQINNFCSDPFFFFFDDICQGSSRLFQSLLCWRWY